MNISALSIAVEIEGKPYFVLIPDGCKELTLNMIAGLSDNKELKVISAPSDYKFMSIGDLK